MRIAAVLANSDLIDKLGVAVLPSIPFEISIVGSLGRCFRFLPEPCGAAARDPGSPPPTRRSAALRQTTETDSGRSILVGLAVRCLERLAVQHLCRQSVDRCQFHDYVRLKHRYLRLARMNELGSPLQVFALTGVASIPGERLSKTSDEKFGRSKIVLSDYPAKTAFGTKVTEPCLC